MTGFVRFTIRRKIVVGSVVVVAIGVTAMLIVYAGLVRLQRTIHVLADVEAPTVGAAYEMEINVLGHGMAVLRYLNGGDPQDRASADDDNADFARFYGEYLRLATTPRTRTLAAQLEKDHSVFRQLGEGLMTRRDEQDALFVTATQNLERIDEIIDSELQPWLQRSGPEAAGRRETLFDMEADIAEFWLGIVNYRRTRLDSERERASRNREQFEEKLAVFKQRSSRAPVERQALQRLESAFENVVMALRGAENLESQVQADLRAFSLLREQIDDLLDEDIQVLALQGLAVPRQDADRATQSILILAAILIPLFIVSAAGVAFVLVRSVMRPVRHLISGTQVVRAGDLSHRIDTGGSDELSDLADQFNSMVATLDATTVSKTALEKSEAQLRQANVELRAEVAERRRAQEEQARLEGALKRSEWLVAMGSLVAGVAHEVRNPLFGISSTLDALEVRLDRSGAGATYAQHGVVLRGELERLRKFMQDLLEYGKAPVIDIADCAVADAVASSILACQVSAERQRVAIVSRIEPGAEVWPMDRSRIEQVVRNLLENAIQHSPQGGRVALDADRPVRDGIPRLRVRVTDEGPGFEAAQLPRLFEPFFTSRRGGTGLGLSVAERIVDAHGGTLQASNAPNGGAELTFELPLRSATTRRAETA